jgi:lysophospholipase L1-like esterase
VAYALVVTASVLLLGEVALRAMLPDPRVLESTDRRRGLAFGYDPLAPVTVRDAAGQVRFARNPSNLRPQVWSSRKPAGTYRVIVVGDSTVFGQLTEALAAGLRVPGRTVEVLNYGMPGAASDRVRILWQDALRQSPDLLLLYVGHNEWIEAAINPMSAEPFAWRAWKSRIRNAGWGRLLGRVLGREIPAAPSVWSPKEEWDAVAFPPWPDVARRFGTHLDAMCRAATGRTFAFVEPASNLLAPGHLSTNSDPDGRVKEQLLRGFQALYDGDLARADEDGWAVASAHPEVAPAWVLLGRVRAARGERIAALEHLRRGRELDPARSRVTAGHRKVLEEVARACGAPYVHTEDSLYGRDDSLDASRLLFTDPVHPSARGAVALAGQVFAGLQSLGRVPEGSVYDDSARVVERADPLGRGWNASYFATREDHFQQDPQAQSGAILPDITNPLLPTYNPHALPPLHGGPKGGKNPPPPSPAPPAPR